MQLMPVLLLAVVMAVDGGLRPVGAGWGLANWLVAAMALAPVALIVAVSWLGLRACDRRLNRGRVHRAVDSSDRIMRWSRWLILVNHAFVVLVLNWVGVVRDALGDVIVLDEFAAILPPLLGMLGLWWAYYPLDRRLRDALLIRRLDEGRPVYPTLSRAAYVILQLRLQVLLMLAPLLLIVALVEVVDRFVPGRSGFSGAGLRELATLGVAAGVFLFSPLLARMILDVQPLPPGEVRDDLKAVCISHRVKVRDMLLWNTNGSMINAAVMGLIGQVRYVMLTDALLETLRREQVIAVMAHEIGHVRRHHMPWLVVCLLAAFVIGSIPVELSLRAIDAAGVRWNETSMQWAMIVGTSVQLVIGLLIFGWMCRRFERQADTFAVQHLSRTPGIAQSPPPEFPVAVPATVSVESVHAMCSALGTIADLNNVDPERPSWRHGSIAWRQRYLFSLIGRPLANLPIDRLVRGLKFAAVVLVVIGLSLEALRVWQEQSHPDGGWPISPYVPVSLVSNEPADLR